MLQLCLFKAFRISYFVSFIAHSITLLNLLWVCHVCCFGHGHSSRQPTLSFKPLHSFCFTHCPLSLGIVSLHSFQPLSVHRLPTFQLACFVVRASAKFLQATLWLTMYCSCLHFFCLVLSIVWLRLMQRFFCIYHTGNIVCTRTRRNLLMLPCCTPSLHSQGARRTSDCKPFISFCAPFRMHFHSIHNLQPHPTACRRRFYLT